VKPISWNDYVRLALSYAVFTLDEEDGNWTVEIPVLPGCISWGETRAEAAVMVEDAVHGWLVTALRFGDEVPLIDGYGLGYLDDSYASTEVTYAQAIP
jgi:predicted RNase H-like HicB family nuclease